MNEESSHIELFEQFHLGELTDSERKQFEEQLAKDPALMEEFKLFQKSMELLRVTDFHQAAGEMITRKAKRSKLTWIPLAIAAGIILLIASRYLFFAPPEPAKLFQDYYEPFPSIVSVRSSSPADRYRPYQDYEQGQFQKAIRGFDKMYPSDTVLLYQSLSYLSLQEPDQAILGFQKIPEPSIFTDQVTWYLGLAYLQKGNTDLARKQLSIIKGGDYKYQEASEILEQLD